MFLIFYKNCPYNSILIHGNWGTLQILQYTFIYSHLPIKANKCFYGLGKMFGSRAITKNIKVRMYRTLFRPIVLYGAKTKNRGWQCLRENLTQKNVRAYFDAQTNELEETTQRWITIPFSATKYIERDLKEKTGLDRRHARRKHERW